MKLTNQKTLTDERLDEVLGQCEYDTPAPNAEFADRVRMTLLAETQADSVTSPQPQPKRRRLLRSFARFAIAASIVAAVLSAFWLQTPSSWAQVQEALNSKPWIHLRAKLDDGSTRENWISIPQKKSAFRVGSTARYVDGLGDVQFDYEKSRGIVVRAARRPLENSDSITTLVDQLVRGKSPNVDEVGHARVLETRHRKVLENGKEWLDVELTLQNIDADPALKSVARLEFRVDPATNLPQTMTLALIAPGQNEPEDGQRRLVYEIDYPAEGPADIYALGIPRDTKLDDRVPTDDAAHALNAIATGRREFDPYFAIMFHSVGLTEKPFDAMPFMVIWRRGKQVRTETLWPFEPFQPYSEKPAGTDDLIWWKQQLKHFRFLPNLVCDGKNSYTAELSSPDENGDQCINSWKLLSTIRNGESLTSYHVSPVRHTLPEFFTYPEIFMSDNTTAQLAAASAPEQPKTSLLTVSWTGRNTAGAYLRQRLWLDGERGYVTTRHNIDQLSIAHEEAMRQNSAVEDDHSMRNLQRTPKGLWYPTVVVRSVAKEPKELTEPRELVPQSTSSFLLDFNAEMPDSLFTKKERTSGL